MLILLVITGFIILTGVMILFMSSRFKNRVEKHKTIPADHGIPYQEIEFQTKNNCRLYGWWIQPATGPAGKVKTLILIHGWNRNLGRMMPYIKQLYHKGYNLLVFDARNHGSSDSDGLSSMPKFAEDISAAIDYLEDKLDHKNEMIGIIGLSMAGSAAIYASTQDKRINRIITVGAFAHPAEIMKLEMQKRHIPYFPFIWLFLKFAEYKIGYRFRAIAPENIISKTGAQILLIHGTNDETTPFDHANRLWRAAPANTKLFAAEGKGHSNCHEAEGFWENIMSFLNR